MIIPRSEKHWSKLKTRYTASLRNYFSTIPGIMKPSDGVLKSDAPMNSNFRSKADFQALEGGPWWLRDTRYSAPMVIIQQTAGYMGCVSFKRNNI